MNPPLGRSPGNGLGIPTGGAVQPHNQSGRLVADISIRRHRETVLDRVR
ncbi:MAG: hypothetical protein IGS50_02865 [Synechococcales cyanobacterium C42_A2020_086]|nr:hypothetical protein [Synechococcales cyanobacterium C42_A2020_086]